MTTKNAILKKLTICLPTRNRQNIAVQQVGFLSRNFPKANIFVADNSSYDGLRQSIRETFTSNVTCCWTGGNLSLYENFDFCIDNVNTKYFLLVGDDDYLSDDGFVVNALEALEANPELNLVFGVVKTFKLGRDAKLNSKTSRRSVKNEILVRSGIRPLLRELPMPPILGSVFRTELADKVKTARLSQLSADTTVLTRICASGGYGFIPTTSILIGLHDGNDHLSYATSELFDDLDKYNRYLESWSNSGVIGKYDQRCLLGMAILNRIRNYPRQAFQIIRVTQKKFEISLRFLLSIQLTLAWSRYRMKFAYFWSDLDSRFRSKRI